MVAVLVFTRQPMIGEGSVTLPKAANQDWLLAVVCYREENTSGLKRVHQLESHKAINYVTVPAVIKPANSLQFSLGYRQSLFYKSVS